MIHTAPLAPSTARTGLADKAAEREVAAALESVFPRIGECILCQSLINMIGEACAAEAGNWPRLLASTTQANLIQILARKLYIPAST